MASTLKVTLCPGVDRLCQVSVMAALRVKPLLPFARVGEGHLRGAEWRAVHEVARRRGGRTPTNGLPRKPNETLWRGAIVLL